MKKLNFALFGGGRIGKIHADNISLNSDSELKYIIDPFADNAEFIAHKYACQIADVETALQDEQVDTVIIASATHTHADLIERSAKANKAIFCEKPVDLSIARVNACLKVVQENEAILAVGFNRRFDPDFMSLHEALAQGEIGSLEQLIITSRDPSPPPIEYIKVSGGLFRDMMIHDFDMALWLLSAANDEAIRVIAFGNCHVDKAIAEAGDIDTAMVMIQSRDGRQIHINNSRRASYGYDQRIEAHGNKGMLQATNHHLTQVVKSDKSGFSHSVAQPFFLERYAKAYKYELNHFIEAIINNKPLKATGEDGRRSLILADAALQSLSTGTLVEIVF